MDSTALYDAFRSDVVDVEAPYLWSDEEVWGYAADAQNMFVRLTGGISDFMSEACEVPVSALEEFSELHPSILRIMSATLRSDGSKIEIVNDTAPGASMSADYGRLRRMLVSRTVGKVSHGIIGLRRNAIRWVNIPAADDTVDLHVYRGPIEKISGPGQEIKDIDDDHHLHLLWWMKHLAYSKNDAETFNKSQAEKCKAEFQNYCAFVKSEWERYKHKTRIVAYGGL